MKNKLNHGVGKTNDSLTIDANFPKTNEKPHEYS